MLALKFLSKYLQSCTYSVYMLKREVYYVHVITLQIIGVLKSWAFACVDHYEIEFLYNCPQKWFKEWVNHSAMHAIEI